MAERIQRLSADVVNRIAAGEVVHRPANALKELLENSLDAGATQVAVSVGQGGLKLLQIQDNGRGILREDLPIVCERFTTSKLRTFEDLREIQSFGFRGEALASISHVAHVTITSKTAAQPCAYRASYRDGKLVAKKPGASADPTPCAGKDGTIILVEDLFYNLNTRRQALKNTSEQYQRILDVVQKYAIHFAGNNVGFVCKKHREVSCDVNTTQTMSQLDVVRAIYGSKLANELLEFSLDKGTGSTVMNLCHKVRGLISNANYNLKKSSFILFINNRLVDCSALKRACEYVYSLYLPKHTHPFVYLSVELPPRNVDVNVHPTKREVHFLHEEEIVDAISQAIQARLKGSNESRSFAVQPITSIMSFEPKKRVDTKEDNEEGKREESGDEEVSDDDEDMDSKNPEIQRTSTSGVLSQPVELDLSQKPLPPSRKYQPSQAPQRLVRTDHRANTIDKYFFLDSQRASQLTSSQEELDSSSEPHGGGDDTTKSPPDSTSNNASATLSRKRKLDEITSNSTIDEPEPESDESDYRRGSVEPTQSPQMLTSVQNLQHNIQSRKNRSLAKLFREHTFVGLVNPNYCLLQHRTKLYLVRHEQVTFHLMYQRVLQQFGQMRAIQLQEPISIASCVIEALDNPRNGYDEEDGPKDQLAEEVKTLLAANGPMLAEYFALDIDAQGMLRTLPRVLPDHEPPIHSLPEFIFRLATEVNWEEEEPCFDNVAQALARWYAEVRSPLNPERAPLVLEHVVFPATKSATFCPPNDLNDASVIVPIACLTQLYKIFERC